MQTAGRKRKWTLENALRETAKYTNRRDFRKENPTLAHLIQIRGWNDQAYAHMPRLCEKGKATIWTEQALIEFCSKCTSMEQIKAEGGALTALYRLGKFKEYTAHIPRLYDLNITEKEIWEARAKCTYFKEWWGNYTSMDRKAMRLGIRDEVIKGLIKADGTVI